MARAISVVLTAHMLGRFNSTVKPEKNVHPYHGPERRSGISEEDCQRIAELAIASVYEKTMDRVYADIGRGAVNKVLVAIGAVVVGFLAYAKAKGWW